MSFLLNVKCVWQNYTQISIKAKLVPVNGQRIKRREKTIMRFLLNNSSFFLPLSLLSSSSIRFDSIRTRLSFILKRSRLNVLIWSRNKMDLKMTTNRKTDERQFGNYCALLKHIDDADQKNEEQNMDITISALYVLFTFVFSIFAWKAKKRTNDALSKQARVSMFYKIVTTCACVRTFPHLLHFVSVSSTVRNSIAFIASKSTSTEMHRFCWMMCHFYMYENTRSHT